jgi:ABC-2 type transport system permease protein
MIATLLRPKFLSFRNRWRKASLGKRRSQDVVLLCFSLFVMVGMFLGTRWALGQMKAVPFLVYLPPSLPLGLMLIMLLAMLCISSLASSLGSIFLADDIELLLACPVPTLKLFASRFLYVLVSVSWMPMVFLFPVLLAFGQMHGVPPSFYLLCFFTLVPYFVIPVALAFFIGACVMAVIDPRWTKLLLFCMIGTGIMGVIYLVEILVTVLAHRNDPNQILYFVSTLSNANSSWSPSAWVSFVLSEALSPTGKDLLPRIVLLYSSAICSLALAYLSVELFHGRGYTRIRSGHTRAVRDGNRKPRAWFIGRHWSLVLKEFRSIFRDLAQSTQVLFLVCICLLYLGNLRLFVSIESFPPDTRVWWQHLFFIMHTSITAFFTSSICTRVVFSSVSLEGRQFWLLQIGPLTMGELLRSKLFAWFVPVSLVSAVLFATGTYVIIGQSEMLLYYIVMSLFVSYGIVGLGIGLGAYFADFSWEHPSQLALSLGSFVYMLSSAVLVIANIIPISIILRLEPALDPSVALTNTTITLLLGVVVAAINVAIAQLALRLGERALCE